MSSRHYRPALQGAALVCLALFSQCADARAQSPSTVRAPETDASRGVASPSSQSARNAEGPFRKSPLPAPPVPGQLVNGSGAGSPRAQERSRRVPPILIAFVLLFLVTWIRALVERRRLRAQFRQACEPPPPPPPQCPSPSSPQFYI